MGIKRCREIATSAVGNPIQSVHRSVNGIQGRRAATRLREPVFGLRRDLGGSQDYPPTPLQLYPQAHISSKGVLLPMQGCDNTDIVLHWYKNLHPRVRAKIEAAGFKHLIENLHPREITSCLFQGLAEKWWDTTHTFHFENLGEMTMTPKDFSCITGLAVRGRQLQLDKNIYRKKKTLLNLLGEQILEWRGPTVPVAWIYETYKDMKCIDAETESKVVRAFLLVLFGSVIFSQPSNRVHLHYLSSMKDIDEICCYNWGGAALAYQYLQMDDICRGHTTTIAGIWVSWEIWALEYIPDVRVQQNVTVEFNCFPRLGAWWNLEKSRVERATQIQFYRYKLRDLLFPDVIWHPWGDDDELPVYVKLSLRTNQRRIFLMSPVGGAWYLPERVSIQSMGVSEQLIPKTPPCSMLTRERVIIEKARLAIRGQSVIQFLEDQRQNSYDEYWKMTLTPEKEQCNPTVRITPMPNEDEELPMPPWTIFVPSIRGNPRMIRIPNDVDIRSLEIPPDVQQVSTATANQLLRMVAGLQFLLTEFAQDARYNMIESSHMIHNLSYQLETVIRQQRTNVDDLAQLNMRQKRKLKVDGAMSEKRSIWCECSL